MVNVLSGAKYECLLFDLDDTLYPLSSGLNLACRENTQDYMLHHLHIEESQVPKMCLELYKEHGTTMAGLKALGFEFDNDEIHAYVHGKLPYEILKPDPLLRKLLLSMPQRKIIFTNADKAHAAQVLSRLGLEDCFEGVICFETLNPPVDLSKYDDKNETTLPSTNDHSPTSKHQGNLNEIDLQAGTRSCTRADGSERKLRILCKPSIEAMKIAIRIANINPQKSIFIYDSTRNIAAGKAAGFNTVIVGSSVLTPGADVALGSVHNIKEALLKIWEGKEQLDLSITSTAVGNIVLAQRCPIYDL